MLALPTSTNEVGWYLQYLATPKSRRPWSVPTPYATLVPRPARSTSTSSSTPTSTGPTGRRPASCSTRSRGKHRVPRPRCRVHPDHPHDWPLLIGDETALPAIAGICRDLPHDASGIAFVEIPGAGTGRSSQHPPAWRSGGSTETRHPRPRGVPESLPWLRSRLRHCRTVTCTPTASASRGPPPEPADTSSRTAECRSATSTSWATGATAEPPRAERLGRLGQPGRSEDLTYLLRPAARLGKPPGPLPRRRFVRDVDDGEPTDPVAGG